MAVTIKKIAQNLDLSPATVSLALNGSPLVADKTREKVQAMAAALDYVPNNFGRGLQSKHSRLIGYMCNSIINAFNSETMEGASRIAAENNYGMILGLAGNSFEHFDKLLQLFLEKHVDGIILAMDKVFDGAEFPDFLRKVKQRDVPVMLVATDAVNTDFPMVLTDNFRGGYLAAEHLLKLGHKQLFCREGERPFGRAKGYLAACRDYGVPEPRRYSNDSALIEMLQANIGKAGVLENDDFGAICLMSVIHQAGLRIPEDVSIIGFDDVWYAGRPEFSLTTMAQQRAALGSLAMSSMIDMVAEKEMKMLQLIEPNLVVRESTAAPRE